MLARLISTAVSLKRSLLTAMCLLPEPLWAAQEQQAGLNAEMSSLPFSDFSYLLQVLLSLALVVGAIFLLSYVLRRMEVSSGANEGPIRVLHSVAIGGKEQLLLVEVGGEQILLGRSAGQLAKVHKLQTPITNIDKSQQVFSPAGVLAKLMNR